MGLLSKLLGTAETSDELRAVDGFLLKSHRGTLAGDEQYLLQKLSAKLGLDDAALGLRLQNVLAAKADQAAAKKAAMDPAYVDAGVILEQPRVVDKFLKYSDSSTAGIEEYMIDGGKPLPDLSQIRWRKWPDDDAKTFDYLIEVLKDLRAGKIKAGRIAYVQNRGDRFPPTRQGLPLFESNNPPMSFQIGEWKFIRRRGQTKKQFESALAAFTEAVEREAMANGMAPATVGGARRW